MATPTDAPVLEEQIVQWRSYLLRRQAIHTVDVAELEDHLREQVARLMDAGLAPDEAFLVAVKRMGDLDALSREFALEHSERLWKQLVVVPSTPGDARAPGRTDAMVAFALAVAAAVLVKLPALFGMDLERNDEFYARNASLFVLPLLTGYFAWKRRLAAGTIRWLALTFAAALVVANVYRFVPPAHTGVLAIVHLPVALWLAVGIAYAGGRWGQVAGRM
ncbi:MAG TPA: permease prefix domain 1-containing protein, partial [Gemmatimonadaceae bacterium]|nr:permease prefix domain 1-containing protein [Gemmatimonadaceae bacterium]